MAQEEIPAFQVAFIHSSSFLAYSSKVQVALVSSFFRYQSFALLPLVLPYQEATR